MPRLYLYICQCASLARRGPRGLRILAMLALIVVIPLDVTADEHPDITRVTDRLFQFSHGDDAGAFLLTDAGVALIDPLSEAAARWLQQALQSRYGQTVKFVVYSSHLTERTAGARVFADAGAVIIAHEKAVKPLQNDNAVLPSVVFSDSLTVRLGGQEMVLHYAGPSVTDDALVAHFPAENAMYAGDLVAVERLPQVSIDVLKTANASNWAAAVERMNRTDFVYLLTSHKGIGIQTDGRKHGLFLRELAYRINRALQQGDSESAIRQSVTMENYRYWAGFENIAQIVDGFVQALQAD